MNRYEEALSKLGLVIPEPSIPVANFAPYAVTGKLVYVSGQIPMRDGKVSFVGKLGREFSVEEGQEAARACALNTLSVIRHACGGDLDRVVRCVRLGGFINSTSEFADQPKVMNGASDLMVAVFGERGRHARVAVGVNTLPFNVAVEVDAIFEIE
ncbi:MAG TPA: RidA family protein [Pyrinomonadaceae bacterium]|jgi:enamine deaminase RidA (YjgF/YER057c/UK114 family)|nr:RidA family protein [Pyrinomonadaceae bacterium]